jgi:hypothetical protein
MTDYRHKVNGALASDAGLPGHVSKLDIGLDSIYVKTCWMGGSIVSIDVTLSRGSGGSIARTLDVADLEMKLSDLARCSIEDSCRLASRLLELGSDVCEVASMWKGVNGYPHGVCPQLGSIVPGPLHAAAVLIENNLEEWKKQFVFEN